MSWARASSYSARVLVTRAVPSSRSSAAITATQHDHEFDTVLGKVSFDDNGDLTSRRYVWYMWRDGQYVPE